MRDAFLSREIHDIDLVVSGDPTGAGRAVADLLGGTLVPLPLWNIVRVALPAVEPGGPPFLIDIAGYDGPFEENLRVRDFTVDALGLPLASWDTDDRIAAVVDPLNGRADLARGVLRAGGDGVFQADPGRMLRGVRLANQLGFRMEPDTVRLIRRDAPLLHRVSGERIRDEFMAILAADGARTRLEILDRLDLLCRVIPELEATRNCEQPRSHHYWDVWGHSLHCVEYAEAITAGHRNNAIYTMAPWTALGDAWFSEPVGDGHNRRTVLKLAALLHDIAKPQTRGPDARGRIRFLGHSEQARKSPRPGCRRCECRGRCGRWCRRWCCITSVPANCATATRCHQRAPSTATIGIWGRRRSIRCIWRWQISGRAGPGSVGGALGQLC